MSRGAIREALRDSPRSAPTEGGWNINIVLMGPPGAGKGTQAKRLQAELDEPIIASGDLFRQIRRQDSDLARKLRTYMDRGEYVPDGLTITMIMDRLEQPDASHGFILDGFPRTEAQALALDQHLAGKGQKVDFALHITAPTDVLELRLSGRLVCPVCGTVYNVITKPPRNDTLCDLEGAALERRSDEAPETIRTRLEVYARQTRPLINYYRRAGTLIEVDGSRPIDEVESEIDDALGIGTLR